MCAADRAGCERFERGSCVEEPPPKRPDRFPLYSEPGSELIRGRPAIRGVFERIFQRARDEHRALEITFEFTERRVHGDLAYDVGIYRLGSGRGKFVTVLRRGPDGRWRFAVDAWNSAPRRGAP